MFWQVRTRFGEDGRTDRAVWPPGHEDETPLHTFILEFACATVHWCFFGGTPSPEEVSLEERAQKYRGIDADHGSKWM